MRSNIARTRARFSDPLGRHFLLKGVGGLKVYVRGQNLGEVIFAVECGTAFFIQEYDERLSRPTAADAPIIESIRVEPESAEDAAWLEGIADA